MWLKCAVGIWPHQSLIIAVLYDISKTTTTNPNHAIQAISENVQNATVSNTVTPYNFSIDKSVFKQTPTNKENKWVDVKEFC